MRNASICIALCQGYANTGCLATCPKLVYSRGHIAGPNDGQVTLLALETGYKVQFNWLPQAQSLYCQFTDKASFLVYHPAKKRSFVRSNLALRSDLSYEVSLSGVAENEELHCYMSFASADGKLQGNSCYLGNLTVFQTHIVK